MSILSLRDTAEKVGISADRLRKVWRDWCAGLGFPAPIRHPPTANFAWISDDVDAWLATRGARPIAPRLRPILPTAAEPQPVDLDAARLSRNAERARRQLEILRRQG